MTFSRKDSDNVMKRINKKVLIAALSIMLVVCASVTVLSFTFASNKTGGDGILTAEADYGDPVTPKTNIDRIIENSNSSDADIDPVYHILEIGSSASKSGLDTLVSSEKFRTLVLDGNKTIEQLMAEDKIEYKQISAAYCRSNETEALKLISKADFIYVSNDPTNMYSASNDITQDIYDLLHTASMADYKPMIIDSPAKTQEIANTSVRTFTVLADRVFKTYGNSRYTFSWNNKVSASDYFNLKTADSYYLPLHGDSLMDSWTAIPTVSGTTDRVAKVLTIKNGAADTALTSMIRADLTTAYTPDVTATATYTDPQSGEVANVADIDLTDTYVLGATSVLYTSAYKDTETKPTAIKFESIDISDSTQKDMLATTDYSMYDIVLIEGGCSGATLSNEAYSSLSSAVYGLVHILYDSTLVSTAGKTAASTDSGTLYYDLYNMVATNQGIARIPNVLVASRDDLQMYANATSYKTYGPIVSIINNGSYRGIGGKGSSSSDYTVLEIQPCYPIDNELADIIGKSVARNANYAKLYNTTGNYYTKPSEMLMDATEDEVEKDGKSEYYAWELSKAKISNVTGISVDNINIVHMSTEEFICSKTDIIGSYDLIYIGGNTSALKTYQQFQYANTAGAMYDNLRKTYQDIVPAYSMYYHNGDWYTFDAGPVNSGGNLRGGALIGQVSLDDGASYKASFGLEGGNDLSYEKYQELKSYMAAGLPIVFSKAVSDAFDDTQVEGVNPADLHDIDPDSNMYKLLTYAKDAASKGSGNILWGFDNTKVGKVENTNSKFGSNIIGGYATVFAGGTNDYPVDDDGNKLAGDATLLENLIATNLQRPRLALTSEPVTYNYLDAANTTLENGKLKFKFDVTGTGSTYKYNLYIDDDGNSKFSDEECVKTITDGATGELTYELSSSFYGPVYWKFEVCDSTNNKVASYKCGLSKVPNPTDEKQRVSVLQIMPEMASQTGVPGSVNSTSLLLCTECQQAYGILKTNPIGNSPIGSKQYYYQGNFLDWAKIEPNLKMLSYYSGGLGKHEHKFGIVPYDKGLTLKDGNSTVTGVDDWDSNLADIVSSDYDFYIDIVTTREYEDMCKEVIASNNITAAEQSELIANFTIDASDNEYEKYNEMTNAEKAKFIKQRQNLEKAGDYWQLYNFMVNMSVEDGATVGNANANLTDEISKIEITTKQADANVQECLDKMIKNLNDTNSQANFGMSAAQAKVWLQKIKESKNYYYYYSIGTARYNLYSDRILGTGHYFEDAFGPWAKAKDKEIEFYNNYMKYLRLSGDADTFLEKAYSCVVLGAAEDFGGDDINDTGTASLKSYIEHDKTLVMFHDTISKYDDTGSVNLTKDLKEVLGMDRYHLSIDSENSGISYIYTKLDTAVKGKVDGYEFSAKVSGPTEGLTVTAKQSGTLQDSPFTVSLSDGTKLASGTLNQKVESLKYTVTKKATLLDKITVEVYGIYQNWDGQYGQKLLTYDLDPKATSGSVDIQLYDDGVYNLKSASVSNVVTGSGEVGEINLVMNSQKASYSGAEPVASDQTLYVKINGQMMGGFKSGDKITFSNSKMTFTDVKTTYGAALDGYGKQSISVEILDEAGNGVSDDVSFAVAGKTATVATSSGVATYDFYNYKVTGVTFTTANGAATTENLDNQALTIKYLDVNGDPVVNGSVSADINGKDTFSISELTNSEGIVSTSFKNYSVSSSSGTKNYYLNYKTNAGYDSNVYFQSDLRKDKSLAKSAWGDALASNTKYYVAKDHGKYLSSTGLTTFISIGEGASSTNGGALMYKYAEVEWSKAAEWNMAATSKSSNGTNRATQNNVGIVTSYPFKIASRLNISDTHPQSLELDMEDPDMTVWYSLAGGTGAKGGSSLFSASPNDGVDNYFVYSYGNVFYCGAGHSKVTGVGKENNDERLLYINIICNSVRKSSKIPTIYVYDHESGETLGNFIKVDSYGNYYCKVSEMTDTPEFAYKCITDKETDIKNVKIYYDLDYLENQTSAYTANENHVLIFEGNYDPTANIASGLLKQIGITESIKATVDGVLKAKLQLKPEYFNPYNQEYTYIVIAVTDKKGNTVYQRIKIMLKQYLHDLT